MGVFWGWGEVCCLFLDMCVCCFGVYYRSRFAINFVFMQKSIYVFVILLILFVSLFVFLCLFFIMYFYLFLLGVTRIFNRKIISILLHVVFYGFLKSSSTACLILNCNTCCS